MILLNFSHPITASHRSRVDVTRPADATAWQSTAPALRRPRGEWMRAAGRSGLQKGLDAAGVRQTLEPCNLVEVGVEAQQAPNAEFAAGQRNQTVVVVEASPGSTT